ncbi:MAG: KH domain-containing protein [Dehalococcoidia bacterium]|nr:MAG: KH domain-containing protein [Dehalococcoidia bacterium]
MEDNSQEENKHIDPSTEDAEQALEDSETIIDTVDYNNVINITRDVLEEILSKMTIAADVIYQEQAIVQESERVMKPIVFDIKGDELGILIGRRGQTLACLQYIIRLIVSHKVKASVLIVIDVNGYKQHRYKSLNNLANRIAEEVEANEKSFELEPMPAYERRIVHIALANHPTVFTQSVGVGEARKVVIIPKT